MTPRTTTHRAFPTIYRAAAEAVANYGIGARTAIWAEVGCPANHHPAEMLWRSFSGGEKTTRDNEAVLGLLLLAEVLETAE